jgi:hypothetical protein
MDRPLTDREIAVLRATVGNTGREIALAVFNAATAGSRGATYIALHELCGRGLVVVDRDAFPATWARTPAGTETLTGAAV